MMEIKNIEIVDHSKVYEEVIEFKQLFSNMWWTTDKQFPSLGLKTTYWYKKKPIKLRRNPQVILTYIILGVPCKVPYSTTLNSLVPQFQRDRRTQIPKVKIHFISDQRNFSLIKI